MTNKLIPRPPPAPIVGDYIAPGDDNYIDHPPIHSHINTIKTWCMNLFGFETESQQMITLLKLAPILTDAPFYYTKTRDALQWLNANKKLAETYEYVDYYCTRTKYLIRVHKRCPVLITTRIHPPASYLLQISQTKPFIQTLSFIIPTNYMYKRR